MKKLVIVVLVFAVVWFGYDQLRNTRLDLGFARGETVVIHRGDLTVPINATGPIGALSRHEIKSEASGEVIEIRHYPGDVVKAQELLIRLNKDDEQRSVDRAQADLDRAKATLESAKIKLERLKTIGLQQAQLRIEQMDAELAFAEFNYNKIKRLFEQEISSQDELERVQSNYKQLQARKKLAAAELDDVRVSIDLAQKDIILAEANLEQAQTTLGDARERLAETDIYSPVDGIVVMLDVQIGEVIQSGKTTFTGGTVLAIIANVSKLYVHAEVDEADIGAVCDLAQDWAIPGFTGSSDSARDNATPVKIHVESFHEEEFGGEIERIYPEPSKGTGSLVTYQVDILVTSDNRDKLLIGMQADVEFTAQSILDAVLVPHEAVHRNEDGDLGVYIPVPGEDGNSRDKEFVPCRFGLDNGQFAAVIEGIDEGTEVYTQLPVARRRDE